MLWAREQARAKWRRARSAGNSGAAVSRLRKRSARRAAERQERARGPLPPDEGRGGAILRAAVTFGGVAVGDAGGRIALPSGLGFRPQAGQRRNRADGDFRFRFQRFHFFSNDRPRAFGFDFQRRVIRRCQRCAAPTARSRCLAVHPTSLADHGLFSAFPASARYESLESCETRNRNRSTQTKG